MFFRAYFRQILILGLLVWGGYFLLGPYREYQATRTELHAIESRILERRRVNEELRHEIHRLRTDSRAIERVAREKFNLCRPRETVYDFSQPLFPAGN